MPTPAALTSSARCASRGTPSAGRRPGSGTPSSPTAGPGSSPPARGSTSAEGAPPTVGCPGSRLIISPGSPRHGTDGVSHDLCRRLGAPARPLKPTKAGPGRRSHSKRVRYPLPRDQEGGVAPGSLVEPQSQALTARGARARAGWVARDARAGVGRSHRRSVLGRTVGQAARERWRSAGRAGALAWERVLNVPADLAQRRQGGPKKNQSSPPSRESQEGRWILWTPRALPERAGCPWCAPSRVEVDIAFSPLRTESTSSSRLIV